MFQLKVPFTGLFGELMNVAGELTWNGSPSAESVTFCRACGSLACTLKLRSVPATTQVSGTSVSTGGWLLQATTVICISRITQPTLINTPDWFRRHSRTMKAMLYSPTRFGAFQVIVPVTGLIE